MEILRLIVCLILAILLTVILAPILAFAGCCVGVILFGVLLLEAWDKLETKVKNTHCNYGREQ